jgi:hypothetical protein
MGGARRTEVRANRFIMGMLAFLAWLSRFAFAVLGRSIPTPVQMDMMAHIKSMTLRFKGSNEAVLR